MTQVDFRARKRPHKYAQVIFAIFGVLIVVAGAVFLMASQQWAWILDLRPSAVQSVFLAYCVLYASIWIFYLISHSQDLDVQTLRRLLHDHSLHWTAQDGPLASGPGSTLLTEEKIIASFREKGKTTITTLAIIIAVSTLLTTRSFETSAQILANWASNPQIWKISMLYIGMVLSSGAFVLLLVAIDAIDTSFNEFANDDNRRIVAYFYKQSVFPKYFGLICIIFSFVFYVAAAAPEIASFVIALFFVAGYYYWFPNIYKDTTIRRRIKLFVGVVLCALPFAVRLTEL